MSLVDFVSPTGKHLTRDEIRENRKRILDEAKTDYVDRKKQELRENLKDNSKWLLPSVEKRLKQEKKHKKKKKKEKRKKNKKHSSSDDSSESEEEWVEKKDEKTNQVERDNWMMLENIITVSKEELRKNRKKEKDEPSRCIIEKPGQSSRELNPYWKDGGTGLPQNYNDELKLTKSLVGDQGLEWMQRSLKRSKEISEEKGIPLEEVVEERWGSLKKLESLIAEAEEKRQQPRDSYRNQRREERNYKYDRRRKDSDDRHDKYERRSTDRHDRHDEYGRRSKASDNHHDKYERRNRDEYYRNEKSDQKESSDRYKREDRFKTEAKLKFQKPNDDFENISSSSRLIQRQGNWKKKEFKPEIEKPNVSKKESSESSSSSSEEEQEKVVEETKPTLLTDSELNALAARLVKAEILGNATLVKELQEKLDNARKARSTALDTAGTSSEKALEEVVVLTRTDSKGMCRPVNTVKHLEPSQGRRKKEKVETHSKGERVRYFADDDKYSLNEMFQREKMNSTEDENREFLNLFAKTKHTSDPDHADDVITEKLRYNTSDSKKYERERNAAIKEHKTKEKSLEGCEWCLDNKKQTKHLIVAIGTKSYLCLPSEVSLTEGHCQIVPIHHTVSSTQLDEDVWEEVQIFRRKLTDLFLSLDQDVVFFENSRNLRHFPHMVINCVPMDKEIGDMAPIYFKKAILECETEWSTNKKLIDLSKKDVRRCVPKGLPYFSVDFGKDNGFAHVIEDEKLFPLNFAQEIIGGMLDLDHNKWRKVRKENFDAQRDKVFKFAKLWKKFDFTVKKHSSSSSSSSSSSDSN